MKSFFVTVLCVSLALAHALPIESEPKNTLESVDVAVPGDLNAAYGRLSRQIGNFGYPYYGGGYLGGYPGGFSGGYPGGFGGGYPTYNSANAQASASSSSYGR